MRVLVISSDNYFDKRIERILVNSGINVDVQTKLTRSMMSGYNAVVFSYKNNIPALPKVIERIVIEKKILVLYINNVPSIGQFYSVLNDHYFRLVNEMTMEIELPALIHSSCKYVDEITYLLTKNQELREEIDLLKSTNKAKRILMSKGLSEAESHKFIQTKSMEMRVSKKRLVNLIIENRIDI